MDRVHVDSTYTRENGALGIEVVCPLAWMAGSNPAGAKKNERRQELRYQQGRNMIIVLAKPTFHLQRAATLSDRRGMVSSQRLDLNLYEDEARPRRLVSLFCVQVLCSASVFTDECQP
jgi:hypothetical protein